ncbi:MAG: AI-2E family transporter [Gammaproteobacteria bacterium]|jgi:predicted PurR-regulated permease PerM
MFNIRLFAALGSVFIVGTVFYLMESVLLPFVVAWVLAYLLVPVVDKLNRYMFRWLAILVTFLMLAIVLSGLLFGLVPILQSQISSFLAQLPNYAEQLHHTLVGLAGHLPWSVDVSALGHGLQNHLKELGTHLVQAPSALMSTAAQVIKTVVFIVLVPLVALYLLRDWHELVAGLESFVRTSRRASIEQFMRTADEVLRHYIHGQLLVMLGVGSMYTLGYGLTGINLGLVLGLLAGLVFVIPFASLVLAGIPGLVIAVLQFHDIAHPLAVILTIGVSELVGNTVLMPVLVGRFVRVHPAAVLLFIFAGGALFGILGMVLALPLAAITTAWMSKIVNATPARTRAQHRNQPPTAETAGSVEKIEE